MPVEGSGNNWHELAFFLQFWQLFPMPILGILGGSEKMARIGILYGIYGIYDAVVPLVP